MSELNENIIIHFITRQCSEDELKQINEWMAEDFCKDFDVKIPEFRRKNVLFSSSPKGHSSFVFYQRQQAVTVTRS